MPDVPNLPGVPPLSSYGQFAQGLLLSDAIQQLSTLLGGQWGLFLNGIPAVLPDSVVSFDFRQDYNVPDYPLEQGAFASYNKVTRPYLTRLRLSKGGFLPDRQEFLRAIKAAAATTNLYDVVTPEETLTGVTIVHIDYTRTATNGVGLITADLWLEQIGLTGGASFSSNTVLAPGAASQQNGGTVRPQPATVAQLTAAGTAF